MNDDIEEKEDTELIKEEISSSSSEKIIISSKDNSFTIHKIKSRKALSDTLKKIKNPFIILDEELISQFKLKGDNLNEGESFEETINFANIPEDKFLFLDNDEKINDYYSKIKKNNVIFSSMNYKKEKKEINDEKELFKRFYKFKNKMENKCNICDFCPEYKSLFEHNSIDKFYKTIRKPRSHLFRYHIYDDKRIIMKLFGPKKSSKSIYLRCVLSNYKWRYDIFRPTLIFDISYINANLIYNNEKFKKVFYHEIFSLFNKISHVNKFTQLIDFKIKNTMEFVMHIINKYLKYIEDNKLQMRRPLFCIDNYSIIYDETNYLKTIEKIANEKENYNLYIIYNFMDSKDQMEFLNNINYDFNPGFCSTQFPICYLSAFRNLSEFEKDLENDGLKIPDEYKKNFGENVFFLFRYFKDGLSFENYIEKIQNEIQNELEKFYSKINNKKEKIKALIDIIDNKKLLYYDRDFFMSIPLGYIIISKKKESQKYYFNYCFPLIESILKKLLESTFFIDINDPEFDKLSDQAMSINFDEFINFTFKNERPFFGYSINEIEKAFDEECLEKKSVDSYDEQSYLFSDVIKVLEQNKSEKLSKLIDKYKNKNLLNNKNLIFVFQKFCGKFVDILALVRKRDMNDFSIINFQIKMSNSFKITKKEKEMEPNRMTYLKHKYEFIFGITINDAYIIYVSLYEIPKNFAKDNLDICIFYSREKKTFVDKDGNILNEFPFLKKSKVELISEFNMLISYFKLRLQCKYMKKLDLKKIDKIIEENMMKIEINGEIIVVTIKFNNEFITFAETNYNNFEDKILYYEIIGN